MNHQDFIRTLTQALDQGVRDLDAHTSTRLAGMRSVAVRNGIRHAGHGTLAHIPRHPWLGGAVVLGLLLAGWLLLQSQRSSDTAETDILLLTDDLPPNAYANQDFSKWLKSQGN